MDSNERNRKTALGVYTKMQQEKRGDIKIKGKDDTKAELEGMDVETSEVKKKGEKQSGSSAEAVSLTVLRSCNYFPIDAGNKNKKRWQSG